MRINATLPITLLFSSTLASCGPEPKVDEEGLSKAIRELVPDSILASMKKQGMPINGGANPPNIEGTYLAKPFTMLSSNRASDRPGTPFEDYRITFHHQDQEALTVQVDYWNGPESGMGLGSFIVGEGSLFTVFVKLDSKHTGGSKASMTHVISGLYSGSGIRELRLANYMLDNFGNPGDVWIAAGEGRVFDDKDSCSERLSDEIVENGIRLYPHALVVFKK